MGRPSDPHAKIDLLRAAESVFAEVGLDHARVEDITALAGRSKGAFYLHFESKEEAFKQIVETMLARLAGCISDAGFDDLGEAEPAAHLERLLDKDVEVFEFLWQNRRVVSLLLQGGGSARFGYLIDEFAERARAKSKEWLARGVERGVYRTGLDLDLASLLLSGAYDRVARQIVRLDTKPNIRAWLTKLQRMVILGLGAPEVAAAVENRTLQDDDRRVTNRPRGSGRARKT
jgi:AcrR family transcriptional regulator